MAPCATFLFRGVLRIAWPRVAGRIAKMCAMPPPPYFLVSIDRASFRAARRTTYNIRRTLSGRYVNGSGRDARTSSDTGIGPSYNAGTRAVDGFLRDVLASVKPKERLGKD